MNEEVIFEIAGILHIGYRGLFRRSRLTPKEITECYEYKMFKEQYPKLCKLAEEER